MSDKIYNVLFICTGNSARSIMAEAILNQLGQGRFRAYSAGSHPRGSIHPLTLTFLQQHKHDVSELHSKSWQVFAGPEAPQMDFILTVCDNAAGEACPAWPGQPITGHWGFADPARVEGSDEVQYQAFRRAYMEISNRIRIFLSLPLDKIDRMSLQHQVRELNPRPTE
ncbi:arsenate reductase ArsC [Chromobacterium piscinae]|uniref:Arsenate reductase ArsC n=1 Tax=Chromobacterium piscinae TaxID=686831 RepID=A0ABV0H9C2_9NEIS